MNVSYRWLKQLLGIDLDWRDYVARVAGRGLAVEGVHERQAKPAGVISARVSGFRPHPSADSLWLADLDTGGGQVAVVTAATNLKTGDIVPWARPGARLADGREVGVAELRGVTSWGMVCSYAELGLDARLVAEYNREGIYRLPAGCPVGEDVSALLSLDDVILEFEIMPNRPDCFSVLGIARESAVILGTEFDQALFRPPVRPDAGGDGGWMVDIADANDCRRFSLALLTGVKVGDSPLWLQNRLQSLGVRPVNNVVDVTNYVMFVTGQPLHAYDCRKLPARRLGVRRGREGEKLVTLDGTERTLDSGVLVITSGQAVVGAAGIMGGLDSEVDGCTTEVALECAVFALSLIHI
ncbi:MAG: phenylalanine--tRNA ligase subunit beta, partial [Negativicutes bacterium]|nr:phenylalanine--tRNA ligase subunit beta [Negativicutes bacterium]